MPGFGSLLAGRRCGYAQAFLSIGGLALSVVFGVRFLVWSVANWSRLRDPEGDPFDSLLRMWSMGKWAFLGCAIFLLALLWALATSLQIVRSAKEGGPGNVPPRLQ